MSGTAGYDNPVAALAGTGVTTVADGSRATSDAVLCNGATIVNVGGVAGMIVTDETMLGMLMGTATGAAAAEAADAGDMTSLWLEDVGNDGTPVGSFIDGWIPAD